MNYWGVDVESGKTVLVLPEEFRAIHVTQVSIRDAKKFKGTTTNGFIHLKMKIDGATFTVASLSATKIPQLSCHLVFDREFELFHDCKGGTVRLRGFTEDNFIDFAEDEEYLSALTDEYPGTEVVNPMSDAKGSGDTLVSSGTEVVSPKSDASGDKPVSSRTEVVLPKSDAKCSGDKPESSGTEVVNPKSDEECSGDKPIASANPKAKSRKKRSPQSADETAASAKKQKLAPQKSDGKKVSGGHTAT